ncbi:hypothetical protein CLV84_3712 [Neolewinella xylanilytica]|uniref:Uncharacterized protein n=1 Tax=Neolewinella xylanilytica TaxID=1514080 RepID=A0A2S6I0Q6_9BACT|nr:hypothetical protein [Neolewinella xylanilytica]PPK84550.1 hypothetical protein CLV84_3712 [Neolewinella xylanilytica]
MSDDIQNLRHALKSEGLSVEKADDKQVHLAHGTSVEVIGPGRYRVLSDGHPVSPFDSAEETAGFIKMDWAQRGLER